MAKFTAGVGFGQASGSVAGTTYSRNAYGPYMRNKAIPVNPRSSPQMAVRQRLANLAQSWRALTTAQRTEWATQATGITLIDALGQSYNPSGFQFYTGINSNRVNVSLAIATAPPAQQTQAVITALSATAVGSTGVVTITFAPAIAASSFYILEGTAPNSAGVRFFTRSKFKQLAVLGASDTSPYVGTTVYNAVYGAVGTGDVGKKIAWRLTPVSSNGFKGTPYQATTIVT